MAGNSSVIIIMIMLAVLVCCGAAGVAYYEGWTCSAGFGNNCSSSATPGPSTPGSTSSSPLQTLLATGTPLKVAEADLGTASVAPDTMPSFSLTAAPSYSVSLWIYVPTTVTLTPTTWLSVFGGNGLFFSYGQYQQLGIQHINANPSPNTYNWIYASTAFGTYHHVVLVVSGMNAQTYVDGVSAQTSWSAYGGNANPKWTGSSVSMKFNPNSSAMSGMKVKNCYWFNSQLAASDVATLFAVGA